MNERQNPSDTALNSHNAPLDVKGSSPANQSGSGPGRLTRDLPWGQGRHPFRTLTASRWRLGASASSTSASAKSAYVIRLPGSPCSANR